MKKFAVLILLILIFVLFSLILTACGHLTTTFPAEQIHSSSTEIATFPGPGITGFGTLSLVEGNVVKLDGKMIRISTEKEDVDLDISASTVIWDGITWVANIPTKAGDFITAWGAWNPDNSFAVQRLYVNIENLQGRVGNVVRQSNSASFDITDQYQKSDHITVSPLTEIVVGSTGNKFSYQENPVLPQNGENVEIVGRGLDDGSISAVNITLP